MEEARHIYQAWLDRLASAVWTGDGATVAAAMRYPHSMETQDGEVRFTKPEEMVEAVTEFRAYLTRMGTQAYMRLCDEASFTDDKAAINGTHTTYLLRGGSYLVPPFSNEMTLVLREGQWLGAGIRAACTNHHCTILSPVQLRRQHLAEGMTQIMEETKR